MYCPKCGTEIADESAFCSKCGYAINGAAPAGGCYPGGAPPYGAYHPYATPLKSAGLAAILSFLFTGLGQIYLGKITRGICFILVGVAVVVVFSLLILIFAYSSTGPIIGFAVAAIIAAVVWIYNVFDAYSLANEYNDALKQTGNPPW